MDQLVFQFPFAKKYYEQDFFVSSNNFSAYKLVEGWPIWPGKWLNIFGDSGSGKTHLSKILEKKIKNIRLIEAKNINDKIVNNLGALDCLIIDNFKSNIDEKLLYSILNQSKQSENYVLINSINPINNSQFKIRDLNELQFNNSRNTPIAFLCKDFEDNDISSGGWTIQNVIGNINWVANDQFAQFGEYYGQISNYSNFSNTSCDTWLISPSVDLSAINSPRLSFFSAQNYSGPALEVYVSNDYDGLSNPSVNGTWNPIQVNLSNGNWNWIDSGPINLQQYKGENTYVAFRYQGSNSDGATWEIDDILISY